MTDRLGIMPERFELNEPQQNGWHERMHRTMKQETASPHAASLHEQQKSFNEFRRTTTSRGLMRRLAEPARPRAAVPIRGTCRSWSNQQA